MLAINHISNGFVKGKKGRRSREIFSIPPPWHELASGGETREFMNVKGGNDCQVIDKSVCLSVYGLVYYTEVITMPTATVRVKQETHNILRKLSSMERKPMRTILELAVEEYRRQLFLREANAAYAALRKDPKRWKEELAERKAWDFTMTDGQEDD
jgi:hypothetical protein